MENQNWTKPDLEPGERLDDLHRKNYHIIQKKELFCFGVDAVFLSWFTKVKPGERTLDLCAGNGIVPILLAARYEGKQYTGLEIQQSSVDLAVKSIAWNHLEDTVLVRQGDLKEAAQIFPRASFDVVTCNPPYMTEHHGLQNPDLPKAIARHELLCSLEDVITAASQMLHPGGRFYMIHRPFRLTDILVLMRQYHLEPKRLQFIHSYEGKEPVMVLVEGLRGGKPRITVEAPLVIYQEDGSYTEKIHEIYYE